MLVEEVGQQILLVIRQSIEKSKEVCLVFENELGGDDGRCRRFAHNERGTVVECLWGGSVRLRLARSTNKTAHRNQSIFESGKFFLCNFRGETQDELPKGNQSKGDCRRLNVSLEPFRASLRLERLQASMEGRQPVYRVNLTRQSISDGIRRFENLQGKKGSERELSEVQRKRHTLTLLQYRTERSMEKRSASRPSRYAP